MGALYKCQTNYQCSESLIDLIISSGILYYFIMKAKFMFENNNGILLLIDQTLCVIGTIQMALQVFYFMFASTRFSLCRIHHLADKFKKHRIGFRIVNMHNINKCYSSFQYRSFGIMLDRIPLAISDHKPSSRECVYYCGKTTSYQCNVISNLIMSFIGLMLSIVALFIGFQCVHHLHQYKEYLMDNKNDSFSHQLIKLETRLTQIKILKISGLIQYGVQFSLDVFVYALSSSNPTECTNYLIPTSILTVLIYSLLKLISLITIPVAVFLVCYECNKEYFGTDHHIWNFPNSQRTLKALADQEQLNYVEMSEVK
ncbi:unnamed protein product (macronuclear) [Paramecium tetraurelia]|uniref:Uncharacterized protein n=1 Tax=Paramecium tetraurelia TaxID=5888 RepID=A0DK69_PARTE|nr:uncharacterized protein GSPATT00017765001 [Paramecium tetraurelia]CAK83436.1 unnamed protein product [Paramecium tetraurelia]|eukprot:XP_001450833.1 hypothetical protein (macronuclear) [Paramecium tetraurelia strain d4-2]